jgi:galactose-1-phosphate uridylyltransferase
VKLDLAKKIETARLSLPDGRSVERVVEVRTHPLTGDTGRVLQAPFRTLKIPDLRTQYAHTHAGCPFCPGAVDEKTPRFAPEEFDEPRIAVGEARVFPNLLAYSGVCALTVLTAEHFVGIEELAEARLVDGFRASRAFFHACRDARKDLPYRLLHWNYMPPAGSSMIHPHQQLMATASLPNRLRRLAEGSRRYTDATWKNAWDAVAATAKATGERWVGEKGPWSWVMDPVPQGRYFELVGIHGAKSEVAELTNEDFEPLAASLVQAFRCLASQGFWSFNAALLGLPDAKDHFRCQLRLVPRTFFPPAGCSDVHIDVIETESLALRAPEEVAEEVRAFFG